MVVISAQNPLATTTSSQDSAPEAMETTAPGASPLDQTVYDLATSIGDGEYELTEDNQHLDTNGDGKLSRHDFAIFDINGDGKVNSDDDLNGDGDIDKADYDLHLKSRELQFGEGVALAAGAVEVGSEVVELSGEAVELLEGGLEEAADAVGDDLVEAEPVDENPTELPVAEAEPVSEGVDEDDAEAVVIEEGEDASKVPMVEAEPADGGGGTTGSGQGTMPRDPAYWESDGPGGVAEEKPSLDVTPEEADETEEPTGPNDDAWWEDGPGSEISGEVEIDQRPGSP